MCSRSAVSRPIGERLTSLLNATMPQHFPVYISLAFAAPVLQTIYNSQFVAFLQCFLSISPGLLSAVFISLVCKMECRDLSILLKLVSEEMGVFVDYHEQ